MIEINPVIKDYLEKGYVVSCENNEEYMEFKKWCWLAYPQEVYNRVWVAGCCFGRKGFYEIEISAKDILFTNVKPREDNVVKFSDLISGECKDNRPTKEEQNNRRLEIELDKLMGHIPRLQQEFNNEHTKLEVSLDLSATYYPRPSLGEPR